MRRRQLMAMAAGLPAAMAFRARAQSEPGGSLTYGQSTAVLTLDPVHGSFTLYPGGYEAALCIYDGLLTFDPAMRIVPQLASSFQMGSDLRSCTLKLRPNVSFHDGTRFDSSAVRFNLERLADKQRNPTNRPLWDPVGEVETPDTETVVIHLTQPFSQFPNSLAHASGAMVSPAAVQKYGENGIAKHPIGAGPYRMTSFDPGQRLEVEAFEAYWGGKAKTQRLVFRAISEASTRVSALRSGAVDVVDTVPVSLVAQLKREPSLNVLTSVSLRPIGFAINLTRPPLADLRVRQALNLAVPVETIASRVFFGYAQAPDSPLAPHTQGYAPVSKLVYDPAKAKSLLVAAGMGPDKPLALVMYVSSGLFPNDVAVGEIVANALQQVGVGVQITKVESGSYWDALRQDRANLKWDLALFGFNPSNASGLYQLDSLFKSNADDAARPDVWNIGRYRNPEVDRLLQQAETDPDPAKVAAAMKQAQEIIWHDAPYIWLQINDNVTATRKQVSGVQVWPVVFTVLRDASI
jgi:ABC-type transport system substrate-binding protein